jgi:hypothetical protein
MSESSLFVFGCVIFLLTATGGFAFALMSVRKAAEGQRRT